MPGVDGGTTRLWKLSQYYDRLEEWETTHHLSPPGATGSEPVPSQWELYDLTGDPEERNNLSASSDAPFDQLRELLESAREDNRRVPLHRNDS